MLVPASTDTEEKAQRDSGVEDVLASPPQKQRERSTPALATAILTLFLALPYFIFAGLFSAMISGTRLGTPDSEVVIVAGALIFPAMIVTLLIAGGIGVWIRKPWGWYTAIVAHGTVALFNAKLVTPVFDINYDHPRANEAFLEYFIPYGVPIVIALIGIVLLMLNSTRKACGVKPEKYERRRRSAGRIAAGRK